MSKPEDHDAADSDSADGLEDAFNISLMNIEQDFNVWGDFRKTFGEEKRDSLSSLSMSFKLSAGSLKSINSTPVVQSEQNKGSMSEKSIAHSGSDGSKEMDGTHEIVSELSQSAHINRNKLDESVPSLTLGEQRDIQSWKKRLSRETVFSRYYFPELWELKELKTVGECLELEDPTETSSYLDQPGQEAKKKAIISIFFPGDHDPKSVLLKRGPTLLDGVDERELMLFTHGFLISRIEFNTLLNILFTINSENPQSLSTEKLMERFNIIDTDQSGSLDRCELKEGFNRMGVPISEHTLSDIMERCDANHDETIDVDEFLSVMQSHLKPKKEKKVLQRTLDSLGSWGGALRRSISVSDAGRKLDCAYLFSDIEKVEAINICGSESTKVFVNSSWAELIIAIFIKDREDPLIMVFSKPEHCLAWVDAFRTCYVKSIQMRADSGSRAAQKIRRQVGWQHRIIRASLSSLVVCNDLQGLTEQVANLSPDTDINSQDEYQGYTALHYAVVLRKMGCAKLLLQHGAKVNPLDNDQKTPLDHAIISESEDMLMIRLLKRYGATEHSSEVLFKSAVEEQNELKREKSTPPKTIGKKVITKAKEATGAVSDIMSALRERRERLEKLDSKTTQLHSGAADYAAMAKRIKRKSKNAQHFGL